MGNPYIGEIRLFAGTFPPANWAFCDGASIAISNNDALYSLIGTTYGGDGVQTFNLPDLRSRVPLHIGQGAGLSIYTLGQKTGVEQVTLSTGQLPAHSHSLTVSGNPAGSGTPLGNAPAATDTVDLYKVAPPVNVLAPQALPNAGSNQGHSNIQPILAINFIISLYGIYPTRS